MMHNHDSSIQVIAPFSLLELEKLGYDFIMVIWLPISHPSCVGPGLG